MLMYPHIDPVALSFGPIKLHWYGVMYLLGFLFFFMVVNGELVNLVIRC